MPSSVPEAPGLRRKAVAAGDLLLGPIHMVVHGEFARRDPECEQQRDRREHEIDEWRQCNVDEAVQQPAGVTVGSLVAVLIWRLQKKVGRHVLQHEDRHGGEDKDCYLWHRLYFDKASAVPSQSGGGGVLRKLAILSR